MNLPNIDAILNGLYYWAPTGIAFFAGITLGINAWSFFRTRKTEEIRLTESILKDLRDFEEKRPILEANAGSRHEWGRQYFNAIEWLSFLINNKYVNDKKLIDYFKHDVKKWHEKWFTNDYLEKRLIDGKEYYEEFRKLFKKFKKEENWKDCKCSDCAEEDKPKGFFQKLRRKSRPDP